MSRLHDILMARGRTVINRVQGRSATYTPPDGIGAAGGEATVLYVSAVEEINIFDQGNERFRSVTINVEIGAATGQLTAVHLGGSFVLDIDGPGNTDPWTVHSFPNADVPAGFVRCLVIQRIKQSLVVGLPRPSR